MFLEENKLNECKNKTHVNDCDIASKENIYMLVAICVSGFEIIS